MGISNLLFAKEISASILSVMLLQSLKRQEQNCFFFGVILFEFLR